MERNERNRRNRFWQLRRHFDDGDDKKVILARFCQITVLVNIYRVRFCDGLWGVVVVVVCRFEGQAEWGGRSIVRVLEMKCVCVY